MPNRNTNECRGLHKDHQAECQQKHAHAILGRADGIKALVEDFQQPGISFALLLSDTSIALVLGLSLLGIFLFFLHRLTTHDLPPFFFWFSRRYAKT